MKIELRDWQKDAFIEFKRSNYKGILKVGTGKGKTIFAIYCIKQFLRENGDFRTCVIVPTINLMFQWKKELLKFLELEEDQISLYYGQEKHAEGKVVIFVVNSAVKDSNLLKAHSLKPFDFMVADECHHYGSNSFSKIFGIRTKNSLGLSATPERDKDGTKLITDGLGPKVFQLSHLDDPSAIPNFALCSILVELNEEEKSEYEENAFKIVKLNNFFLMKYGIKPEDDEYRIKIKELADKKIPAALRMLQLWSKQSGIKHQAENKLNIVSKLVNWEKDNKIIIFNERINFTKRLYEKLKGIVPNLFMIHSDLSKAEVQQRLDDFKNTANSVLIAPRLIDEGYDVPDASVAIVVSFTKSARQMIQRDGRILRKTPEKQFAKRYSLVVEDIEEDKYFSTLKRSEMGAKALSGGWLKYDSINNELSNDDDFRQNFVQFDRKAINGKNHFKDWVIKRLNYYEINLKNKDIEEVKTRISFFIQYLDVIDSLSEEFPNRWKNLYNELHCTAIKKVRFNNQISQTEKSALKEELRDINGRLLLPDNVFSAMMRFIENEPFELDDSTKRYIEILTAGDRPNIWPERLYLFLQNVMRKMILK